MYGSLAYLHSQRATGERHHNVTASCDYPEKQWRQLMYRLANGKVFIPDVVLLVGRDATSFLTPRDPT